MQTLIQLDKLTAGYDGRPQIKDVCLQICRNDFVGIIGPNGGGKTTLLRVIMGLLEPMEGSVRYFDEQGRETACPRIGYLPQYNDIDRDFPITVREVVNTGLLKNPGFWRKNSEEDERLTDEVIQTLRLERLQDRAIGELSGGELQRTLMARALVAQPQIIVLDEPNTYIDCRTELQMHRLLEEMDGKRTIIMVSHNRHYIEEHAKTVVRMEVTATVEKNERCYRS